MKKIIFIMAAFMANLSLVFAVDKDEQESEIHYLNIQGECFITFSNDIERKKEAVECPTYEPDTLTELEVAESISSFFVFEQSEMDVDLKKAAFEFEQLKQHDDLTSGRPFKAISQNYPENIAQRLKYIKDGLYKIDLVFYNDQGFPKKYSDNPRRDTVGRYYRYINNGREVKGHGRTEELDAGGTAEWDRKILLHYLGKSYQKYKPAVFAVSNRFVTLHALVQNGTQLQQLVSGKNLVYLRHAGDEVPVYEELKPAIYKN